MSENPADPMGWIVSRIGEAPLRSLVAAFYRRIPADDVLAPMYPEDDLAGAERRLGDFLIERCGGESHYSSARGHPRLRMRHGGFAIDATARDRWFANMLAALSEVELPREVRAALERFLGEVATFLVNRD